MANTKFSQFTNQTLTGTGFVVGYDGGTNTRYTVAQLSSALNLGGYVTIATDQSITGYKTFGTGIAIGAELPTSLTADVMLYLGGKGAGVSTTAIINAQNDTNKYLKFQSVDSDRFWVSVEGNETGSNLGGNFYIRRFSDAGAYIDSPIAINRQSGLVSLGDVYKNNYGVLWVNSFGEIRPYTGLYDTQLSYLVNINSDVQNQLDGKQDYIFGAASSITENDLTPSRALVSDGSGKVAASGVTSTTLGYLDATSSIQTQFNNVTSIYSNVSQVSTTSTSGSGMLSFTIPSSSIPIGGVVRIVGLMTRTAGTGNTSLGLTINSAASKYFQNAGNVSMQFEILVAKITSTTLRYGLGTSASTAASFATQASASTTATQDGSGNFVFTIMGFVGTVTSTMTIEFLKVNLL